MTVLYAQERFKQARQATVQARREKLRLLFADSIEVPLMGSVNASDRGDPRGAA